MKKRVYLAGPISGLSYEGATNGWRRTFTEALAGSGIECMSPMRGKQFLAGREKLGHSPAEFADYQNAIASAPGIVCRDRNDVMTCNAMVACFLGAEKVSIGTCIEFGWADAFRKPIVMVIEKPDLRFPLKQVNPHEHAMLLQMAGYVVYDLETAAEIVAFLLQP